MQFSLPPSDLIIEIHDLVIEYYGGRPGILHPQMLQSAVHRPNNYMDYDGNCDIHMVAALVLEAIATYHIFADGNKRTALITMLITYRMNGFNLDLDHIANDKLERLVLKVAGSDRPTIRQLRYRLSRVVTSLQNN